MADITDDQVSFAYEARIGSLWEIVPSILSAVATGSLQGFDLKRSITMFRFDPSQSFSAQDTIVSAGRLDARVGLRAAFDVAALFGVVPYVFGEFEYIRTSAEGSTVAVNVPSGGLGLGTVYE